MIPIVYPGSLNWFYEAQAVAAAGDLTHDGVAAQAVGAAQLARQTGFDRDTVMVVSFAESLVSAERAGMAEDFLKAMAGFKRRILLNFDSRHSSWFDKHFSEGDAYFADIFDIGLYRQTDQERVHGARYRFVPEAFAADERARIKPWSAGRPIPWAVLGHATIERSALIGAALLCLPKNGFVYSPLLRPFDETSSLNRAAIERLMRKSDLYLWGSHHYLPYHETQRALHAVAAGAVPVKIDPLYATSMNLPWVYTGLQAFIEARDQLGLAGLHEAARRFLEAQGTLGGNLRLALEGHDADGPNRQPAGGIAS